MAKKNSLSLASKSLKYKLKISFYLLLVLPLLIFLYLLWVYILPIRGFNINIAVFIIVDILLVVSGFLVISEALKRIISMSSEAKLIAQGDLYRHIDEAHTDEIGELASALNQVTERIRYSMGELKTYGERTTEINLEIQRRVLALSGLLQISSLISQGAKLDDILSIAVEKSRQIADSDAAYLLFQEPESEVLSMRAAEGINSQYLLKIRIVPEKSIFCNPVRLHVPLLVDEHNSIPAEQRVDFYEQFKLKNTLAIPIYSRGKLLAILGIGNTRDRFSYNRDSIELVDVFAKQIAIAVENDLLIHRVEKLEIKDALTGLYNESYIRGRLEEEIKRAVIYQRPCSFILLNVDNFNKFRQTSGALAAEITLKRIASLIKEAVTEVDRVARFGDNEFAVLTPEKNKRQAIEVAENIRKRVESSFSAEPDLSKKLTLSGGISENPLDGIKTDEIIKKAKDCLSIAKGKGKNSIIAKL
jgi:diguanylate cyclase (GGDEF)-like protein